MDERVQFCACTCLYVRRPKYSAPMHIYSTTYGLTYCHVWPGPRRSRRSLEHSRNIRISYRGNNLAYWLLIKLVEKPTKGLACRPICVYARTCAAAKVHGAHACVRHQRANTIMIHVDVLLYTRTRAAAGTA